jgi:ring-1,2-phenylacetyl-CoA epoxidase subunit PaaD
VSAAVTATADVAARAADGARGPSLGDAWAALSRVCDPEIPVLSIVELGIVRDLRWDGPTLRVRITPTYSGCPATDVILADIHAALASAGVADAAVDLALSPPWSTDRIAPEAKRKLADYGIAPPGRAAARVDVAGISPLRRAADVACPRCGSKDTKLLAQFGSTACKALYRCEACREPFDYFKPY